MYNSKNPKFQPSGGFLNQVSTDANGIIKTGKSKKLPFRPPTTFDINDHQAAQTQRHQQLRRQKQTIQRQDVERMRNPEQFKQKLQQRHQDPAYRALNAGKAPTYY